MTSFNQQSHNIVELQHPVYTTDQNAHKLVVLNSGPPNSSGEIPHEQQIMYYNGTATYHPVENAHTYGNVQQMSNSQVSNYYPATNFPAQNIQQTASNMIIPFTHLQHSMIHANTYQQQIPISTEQPHVVVPNQHYTTMSNAALTSTPLNIQNKRGRNDTSGVSDSNVQLRPQYPQTTRIFNSSNTANKRIRGNNQQRNDRGYPIQFEQNQQVQMRQNGMETTKLAGSMDNKSQPSVAACRFATSRYPFSPFSVVFEQEVREKKVVDDLIKHALDNSKFELKTVAYRKGRSENKEHRILIFVENSESFAFLYDHSNWPVSLADCHFTVKSPSIPPQLALVLPIVSLQIDWDDFVQEMKGEYPGVVNVIRLKNKAQQPVRAVKLELMSSKVREEILAAGVISILHMKLKVVEYYSQANVLICSNCYGIGHFRKNCPQKNESTCKTCGEKCTNLKDHQCSGVPLCIHCGGSHVSNDAKCKVVKDYRAALTRNLLANGAAKNVEAASSRTAPTNVTSYNYNMARLPYATVTQTMPSNSHELLLKKLDSIQQKVEEEATATRRALGELKEEMRHRYEETKQQVELLENKVMVIEKKFQDFSQQISSIMHNVCTSLFDPEGSQSTKWKSYWQEQIKTFKTFKETGAFFSNST